MHLEHTNLRLVEIQELWRTNKIEHSEQQQLDSLKFDVGCKFSNV